MDGCSITDLKSETLEAFSRVHLFAGISGWQYAMQIANWPAELEVWSGSCPCQPFSCAGSRKGFEDKRHLWPEMRRLIDERRPAVIVGEQVTSKAGKVWFSGVRADLEELGYRFAAADLCSASIGSPNIRQRLFWFAINPERLAHSSSAELRSVTSAGKEPAAGCDREDSWLADNRIQDQIRKLTAEKDFALQEPGANKVQKDRLKQIDEEIERLKYSSPRLPERATTEGLFDVLEKGGGGIILLSEFGPWVKAMEASHNATFKATMTVLYDVPKDYKEVTRGGGYRAIQYPFISVCGVSTLDWVQANYKEDDLGSGFLRFCSRLSRSKSIRSQFRQNAHVRFWFVQLVFCSWRGAPEGHRGEHKIIRTKNRACLRRYSLYR